MSASKASKTWFIVHVIFPLVPFFLEGFVRAGVDGFLPSKLCLQTFSAPTLAMSIGLLSLFVNQSLHNTMRPLTDNDELEQIHGTATMFLIYAIFSFAIFGILVLLLSAGDLSKNPKLETGLKVFQITVFVMAALPVWFSISAQRAYKLRASI